MSWTLETLSSLGFKKRASIKVLSNGLNCMLTVCSEIMDTILKWLTLEGQACTASVQEQVSTTNKNLKHFGASLMHGPASDDFTNYKIQIQSIDSIKGNLKY